MPFVTVKLVIMKFWARQEGLGRDFRVIWFFLVGCGRVRALGLGGLFRRLAFGALWLFLAVGFLFLLLYVFFQFDLYERNIILPETLLYDYLLQFNVNIWTDYVASEFENILTVILRQGFLERDLAAIGELIRFQT